MSEYSIQWNHFLCCQDKIILYLSYKILLFFSSSLWFQYFPLSHILNLIIFISLHNSLTHMKSTHPVVSIQNCISEDYISIEIVQLSWILFSASPPIGMWVEMMCVTWWHFTYKFFGFTFFFISCHDDPWAILSSYVDGKRLASTPWLITCNNFPCLPVCYVWYNCNFIYVT